MRSLIAMAVLGLTLAAFAPDAARAGTETTVTETRTTQMPSGRMVVTSQTKRTFHLGDDTTHVYVAPETVDLTTLRDKQVTVYVDDTGRVTKVTRYEVHD